MLENSESNLLESSDNQSNTASQIDGKQTQNTNINEASLEENVVKPSENEPENKGSIETQEAIDTMEKRVAINAEKQSEDETLKIEIDREASIEDIVKQLQYIISNNSVQNIAKPIDELKRLFNIKFGVLLKEAREKHKDQGGEPSDFHYENPLKEIFNNTLLEYKNKRQDYQEKITKERESSLKAKENIIESIKDLIENGNPDNIYNDFKNLQDRWKEIGPVPRENYRDLWQTYHFHIERFYDLLHLSNELRDVDFERNLQEKTKLILKAETLAESDDIKTAFSELQILHKIWKEDIGPVAREYREEVWNRFSAATKKIHDKRHNYYDGLKEQFEQNLLKKEALLEALKLFNTKSYETHTDWQKAIKEVEELRGKFVKSGKVPKDKDTEVWEKFRAINKEFNQAKNNYYRDIKREQQDNLDKKIKLIQLAESYKDSEDFHEATQVMKKIQQDWKNIGHVPRKMSDKVWSRFKEACNHYFDRLRENQSIQEEGQAAVYLKKKEYFNNLKLEAEKEGFSPSIENLMEYVNQWKELGVVSSKQRFIDAKFNKFLDPYFEKVSEDKVKFIMLRYKANIDPLIEQKDSRKINDELQFVRKKVDHISKEKQQMETNKQFFNTDDSNPMMKNINKEIDRLSQDLDIWESKLEYLRSIDL